MARARKPHPHVPHGHHGSPAKPKPVAGCAMNLAEYVRALSLMMNEYDPGDDTSLRTRIVQAKTYVDNRLYRAELVATLPSNGDAGHLYTTPSDPVALYMGRGPSLTLLRFVGTPLP